MIKCTFTASLGLQLLNMCLMCFLFFYYHSCIICAQDRTSRLRVPHHCTSAPTPFPMTNTALKGLVSLNPGFSKNCRNLISSCDCSSQSLLSNQELQDAQQQKLTLNLVCSESAKSAVWRIHHIYTLSYSPYNSQAGSLAHLQSSDMQEKILLYAVCLI